MSMWELSFVVPPNHGSGFSSVALFSISALTFVSVSLFFKFTSCNF